MTVFPVCFIRLQCHTVGRVQQTCRSPLPPVMAGAYRRKGEFCPDKRKKEWIGADTDLLPRSDIQNRMTHPKWRITRLKQSVCMQHKDMHDQLNAGA